MRFSFVAVTRHTDRVLTFTRLCILGTLDRIPLRFKVAEFNNRHSYETLVLMNNRELRDTTKLH